MKLIKLKFIMLILFMYSCGTKPGFTSRKDIIEYRKQYAFSDCFRKALDKKTRKKIDKIDMSEGMLFDIGNLDINITKKIDSLVKIAIDNIKPSQIIDNGNRKPIIARCLDFSNSKEVKKIIKKNIRTNLK